MLVIIPSYNDRPFLERLFESLFTEPPGAPFRVLVVNDFSTDGTAEWLTTLKGIDVIQPKEKAYFTRSCNAGLQWGMVYTDKEWLFLLNSDTIVTPGWCAALQATGKKLKAGIVGATLLNMDGTIQHLGAYGAGYHFGINKPWVRYQNDRLVPWVTGAAMCINRDVMRRTDGLPPYAYKQYDGSDKRFCTHCRISLGVEVAVSVGCRIYHDTHEARSVRMTRGDYTRRDIADG